jgi:hypothetical protein
MLQLTLARTITSPVTIIQIFGIPWQFEQLPRSINSSICFGISHSARSLLFPTSFYDTKQN